MHHLHLSPSKEAFRSAGVKWLSIDKKFYIQLQLFEIYSTPDTNLQSLQLLFIDSISAFKNNVI